MPVAQCVSDLHQEKTTVKLWSVAFALDSYKKMPWADWPEPLLRIHAQYTLACASFDGALLSSANSWHHCAHHQEDHILNTQIGSEVLHEFPVVPSVVVYDSRKTQSEKQRQKTLLGEVDHAYHHRLRRRHADPNVERFANDAYSIGAQSSRYKLPPPIG